MSPSPGRSLTDIFSSERSGQVNPDRNYVLIGKERHDYSRPQNQGYPVRGIVSDGHLFLRNYAIDRWPAGNPELGYLDVDGSPTKTSILELFRSESDRSYWTLSFGKREVEEELYDVRLDPECLLNLQGEANFDALRQGLRERMESLLREQGDPRMFGEGELFDSYGYSEEKAWNFYERFMEGEFGPEDTGWVNPSDYEIAPLD